MQDGGTRIPGKVFHRRCGGTMDSAVMNLLASAVAEVLTACQHSWCISAQLKDLSFGEGIRNSWSLGVVLQMLGEPIARAEEGIWQRRQGSRVFKKGKNLVFALSVECFHDRITGWEKESLGFEVWSVSGYRRVLRQREQIFSLRNVIWSYWLLHIWNFVSKSLRE